MLLGYEMLTRRPHAYTRQVMEDKIAYGKMVLGLADLAGYGALSHEPGVTDPNAATV